MTIVESPYERSINIDVVRSLSGISTTRWLWAAISNWIIIVGVVGVCFLWSYWPVYIAAIVIIGTRQHALGILMHEGSHYRIASSHFWNDFLCDYLAAYPLLAPTEGYRKYHLKHHRLLDTDEDPERITVDKFNDEWRFPMPQRRFWWLLLRALSGTWPKLGTAMLLLTWNIPGRRVRHIIPIMIMHVTTGVLLLATGYFWTLILFWWLPLFTVFLVAFRLRAVAEHCGIITGEHRYTRAAVDVLATTRTTISNPLTLFFLCPHGMNYHTEHHLYPSVPYFRLHKIHNLLQADPQFASRCHKAIGYWQVITELTGK